MEAVDDDDVVVVVVWRNMLEVEESLLKRLRGLGGRWEGSVGWARERKWKTMVGCVSGVVLLIKVPADADGYGGCVLIWLPYVYNLGTMLSLCICRVLWAVMPVD